MRMLVLMNGDGDVHEMSENDIKKYQMMLREKQKNKLWERIKRNIDKKDYEGEKNDEE